VVCQSRCHDGLGPSNSLNQELTGCFCSKICKFPPISKIPALFLSAKTPRAKDKAKYFALFSPYAVLHFTVQKATIEIFFFRKVPLLTSVGLDSI
jgi:hypothetical protein